MKMSPWIWIGGVTLLMIAFLLGRTSTGVTLRPDTSITKNNIQVDTAPVNADTTGIDPQTSEVSADTYSDGQEQSCQNEARLIVASHANVLTQAHYSIQYANCYYEEKSSGDDESGVFTQDNIYTAPNGTQVAFCTYRNLPNFPYCAILGSGSITPQQFGDLLNLYFNN
jgi:hypothetical protein